MPKVKEGKGKQPTRPPGKPAGSPAEKTAGRSAVKAKARTTAAPRKAKATAKAPAKAPARAAPKRATKAAPAPKARARGTAKKQAPTRAKALPARKGAAAKKGARRRQEPIKLEPVRDVRIRELDPTEKCGPETSVLQLFRVDESLGRELTTHLVFFDRHGWYCEHGRTCRAVADVHKLPKGMLVGL